jgi:hypothetical protein
MKHLHFRLRSIFVSIAACLLAAALLPLSAGAVVSDYGIASTSASLSTTQAGGHPDTTLQIDLKRNPETEIAYAGTRDLSVELPPGLVARTNAFPVCPISTFIASAGLAGGEATPCPVDSQVGIIKLGLFRGGTIEPNAVLNEPLYNLPPPDGAPARLGFAAALAPTLMELVPRAGDGYGFTARIRGAPDLLVINSAEAIVWGVPADPAHDDLRLTPHEALECGYPCEAPNGQSRPSGLGPLPLMTNPTTCGPQRVGFAVTSYSLPGEVFRDSAPLPPITGCDRLGFAPTISVSATNTHTDSPSGLRVVAEVPGDGLEHENTLAPAAIKTVTAELPEGVTLNTSAAAGLGGCSEREIGLVGAAPPRFDAEPAACPDASRIGTTKIESPILERPLDGSIFLATPQKNPFDSLTAVYLVAEGDGMNVKLAGRLDRDVNSGRLTIRFDELPQQPISDIEIVFKGGSRGLLTTPATCGTYNSSATLLAWAGQTKTATPTFETTSNPGGGPCGTRPFLPTFSAGTIRPVAGAASDFVLRVTRAPGEQALSSLSATLPAGLLPGISGVAKCRLSAAEARSCPADSNVGTASILSGSGPNPLRLPEPGSPPAPIYLGGPYRDAPLSLIVTMPVEVGPFELAPQVVQVALDVNPVTARVTASSDPFPQIVEGIPIAYRELRLELNRPGFVRNPTSCNPDRVSARITSLEGATFDTGTRFQVGSCSRLPFRPRLGVAFEGRHARNAHPRLRVALQGHPGDASISSVSVLLPATELLDGSHISKVCLRSEFASGRCPKNSIYGQATLKTPLLDGALRGPIYLRASRHRLPDLVADLGGAIRLEVVGRIDAVHKRLRASFKGIPDAPMTRFALNLDGGHRGLLVNTVDLCRSRPRMSGQVNSHNGRHKNVRPFVKVACPRRPDSK